MEQCPRDMCRYSRPPHLQSSWVGFEIRLKTGSYKFGGITHFARKLFDSNVTRWKLLILFHLLENVDTRRNQTRAATMASEGRMGSNKYSFGMLSSFLLADKIKKFISFDCMVTLGAMLFCFYCIIKSMLELVYPCILCYKIVYNHSLSWIQTGRIWTINLYSSKASLWRVSCK